MFDLTLPTHPLTGLRALGVVGGRPVWPILGGSEPTPEGAPAPTPAAPAPAAPAPAPGVPAPVPSATAADPAAEPEGPRVGEDAAAFLARVGPQGAAKLALQYRNEAGDRRQELRTAEQTAEQARTAAADQARNALLDQLKPALVAAGLIKADEQPDPAKLTTDLQTATTEARTLRIENAVLLAAPAEGVDAARLLDSKSFAQSVASLDPADAKFGDKIGAAIKAAADKDATLKTTRAVAAAGLPHVGGSGGQTGTLTAQPLAAAVAAAMNPTR